MGVGGKWPLVVAFLVLAIFVIYMVLGILYESFVHPATILTGPEGGFTDAERAAIRAAPGTRAISLGPRILRAETAALAALVAYMAIAGDWR